MSEFITIVVVLGLVLAFITVIGHGIWCLIAFLFSSLQTADDAADKPVEGEKCPRCSTVFRSGEGTCSVCSWPEPLPMGERRLSVTLAIRRQLYLYRQLGLVGEATYCRLVGSLDEASRPTDDALAQTTASVEKQTPQPADDATVVDAELVVAPEGSAIEEEASRKTSEHDVGRSPRSSILDPQQGGPAAAGSQPAAAPRQALGKLLSAFLEEKNIRWGELVGGMLIVCCSIALVISFWSEIAQRPLLKFCVFNGVSAAIFGAGLYTDRRWNLHTTSRGLLIVALLLLPLNFLAIAAFTSDSPPTDLLSLGGEGVSLVLFTLLSYFAARVLTPDGPWLMALGVMFPSLMQLLARRYGDVDVPTPMLFGLAVAPLVSYVAAVGLSIRPILKRPSMDEQSANRQFILLGIVTFATLLPLGLLVFKTQALVPTLQRIAPLATLVGLPALAMGLLFWRRLTARELVSEQTVGIGVGVLGAVVMMAALALAWPNPQTLLAASLVNAAAFLLVALWFAVPQLHMIVGVCAMTATLVMYHVLSGNVAWNGGFDASLAEAMFSASSGNVLAPLAGAYLAIAYALRRGNRAADALWWVVSAGVVAVVSLALVTLFGFARTGDPRNVTWTYAFFATALAAASLWLERRWIAWMASGLMLVALVQGVVFRYADAWNIAAPWSAAFLLHASFAAVLYVVARRRNAVSFGGESREQRGATPARLGEPAEAPDEPVVAAGATAVEQSGETWLHSALATSLAAAVLLLIPLWHSSWLPLACQLAWLSAVWLALAVVDVRPRLFAAFQVSLALALFFGVTQVMAARAWYQAATLPWLDPWFLQAQGVALSAYCLIWTATRMFVSRRAGASTSETQGESVGAAPWPRRCRELLEPTWLSFDRLFEAGALVLLLALSAYAAAPLVAQELAPLDRPGLATRVAPPVEYFTFNWMPLQHAQGIGAWALLAAVLLVLVVGLWESRARWRGIGLMLAGAAVCPLAATWWAESVSGASALRWLFAAYVAVASVSVWARSTLCDQLRRIGIELDRRPSRPAGIGAFVPTTVTAFALLVTLFVGTHLAMVGYVSVAVVAKSGVPPELSTLLQAFAVLAFVATLIATLLFFSDRNGGRADVASDGSRTKDGGSKDEEGLGAYPRTPRSVVLSPRHLPALTLFLGIGPLFVTYAFLVAAALRRYPIVGPEPDAWFREIGWSISYGLPLVAFALTLVGHAIRERSSRIAFAAGILFNLIATVVYLLEITKLGRPLDGSAWVEVTQVNSIVASIASMTWIVTWIAALRWHRGRAASLAGGGTTPGDFPRLLTTQTLIAAVFWMLPMIPAVCGLAIEPRVWPWVAAAGGPIGWTTAALAIAALVARSTCVFPGRMPSLDRRRAIECTVGPLVAATAAFVALVFAHYDTGDWLGYHALLAGVVASSCLLPTVGRLVAERLVAGRFAAGDGPDSWLASSFASMIAWSSGFAAASVTLALRAFDNDPASPWWTLAALGSTTILAVYLAWISARREFLWVAGVLAPLTISIWWLDVGYELIGTMGVARLLDFLYVNVLAVAAMALVSCAVESRRMRPPPASFTLPPLGFHRFASWACVAAMLYATTIGLAQDLDRHTTDANVWLAAATLVATAVAALACLWDAATRMMVARLWSVGFLGTLAYLDARNLADEAFVVTFAVLLAAFALASSLVWNQRARLRAISAQCRVPVRRSVERNSPDLTLWDEGHAWMILANGVLAVVVSALAFWMSVTFDNAAQQTLAATGILGVAISLALLASGTARAAMQLAALGLGVLFAIAAGWTRLPPSMDALELHRAVVALVAMAATIPLYALLLARMTSEASGWPRSARNVVCVVTAVAGVVLLAVLAAEVYYYATVHNVPLRLPAMVAVLAALVMLSLASLAAAILPGRDPLQLGERGRTAYVYAAEVLLALAFLHVRVTMPWLFGGWFMRFWPLVIVAIAFLGVGFAELCRRRQLRVLSEPLENTGALLPLLPTAGFWILSSDVNYSLLLLSVAALYSVLCLLRKSFWFGMLAAVSANGSLWYWLYATDGLALYEHPQLWLIPPALCVLVAAQLNRARLSGEQMTAIRYLSAIVVYASSTTDVFINGVGDAPWLPVALAGLALLGIFAGILLRVRAFLYLGTSFLMVALFTVIWHAAVEQDRTWIWWVTGIVTGVLIIALFGLFEKKRDDMLRLVERIKAWEA